MIAAWMMYSALCGLGFSAAAALVEHALLRGRASVRMVWVCAVALSVVVPAVAYRFAQRTVIVGAANTTGAVSAGTPATGLSGFDGPSVKQQSTTNAFTWRATLGRFNGPLLIVWLTLSIAVACNFFGGILVLRWMRRSWQRRTVMGVPVLVSARTGPAVVGVLAPAIVLPEWVLALEPAQLSLMLRHEDEHRRAGDGRVLALAQLALIVMPWNLAVWWQILRLRVAVELDCDARVLRDADARSYGDLLLEVARPRRGPTLMGVTAFAERAAQLERRIRLLPRHRARTTRRARVVALCTGVSALTVAWAAPHPAVPPRVEIRAPAIQPVPAPAPAIAAPPEVERVEAPAAPRPQRNLALTKTAAREAPAPCGNAATRESPRLADQVFDKLFGGLALSTTQASKACDLLLRLEQEQNSQNQNLAAAAEAERARRMALIAQRDTALRALLTNDEDRARFNEQVITQGGGARIGGGGAQLQAGGRGGRGGGEPGARGARQGGLPDSLLTQMVGRAGGRGGRGGGGGQAPGDVVLNDVIVEMNYRRIFNGIQLSADQEAAARDLIGRTLEQTRPRPQFMVPLLRVDPVSGLVSMSDASAAELNALLTNDADRETLKARIVSVSR